MNYKLTLVSVLLILALVTLACGLGTPSEEEATVPPPTEATGETGVEEQPTAPPPTSQPESEAVSEEPGDYDTDFPLPDDVQNFVGEGGVSQVSFQTSLSIEEAVAFYRGALAEKGLTEYEILTSIQDDGFSLVFASWPSGEEVVVQGVDFGDTINVSVRLEEVVEGEINPPPPGTELGEELSSEVGGFACQTIPGYTVEEAFGFASMEAPDADPDLGPAVLLVGGAVEEEEGGQTAQDLYDDFVDDLEAGIEVSEPREITVDGVAGLVADIEGATEGKQMGGRVVFVVVSPGHHFTTFAAAPMDRWEDELAPLFDAMVASITFFEPSDAFDLEEEESKDDEEMVSVDEDGLTHQWATSATASSEYSNPDWAAIQATGAPDTSECGDFTTAWASSGSDTVEWIELGYELPVYPTGVNVYQSYNPDQVLLVELLDASGEYHDVYLGEFEDKTDHCPYVLTIPVADADYMIVGVKITIDQSALGSWNEIDAVELVGIPE